MSEDINNLLSNLLSSISENKDSDNLNNILKSFNLNESSNQNIPSDNDFEQFAENIDIEQLIKIIGYINPENTKNDPRYRLLFALRPYMSDNKKKLFDKYSKYIGFLRILDDFKK